MDHVVYRLSSFSERDVRWWVDDSGWRADMFVWWLSWAELSVDGQWRASRLHWSWRQDHWQSLVTDVYSQ